MGKHFERQQKRRSTFIKLKRRSRIETSVVFHKLLVQPSFILNFCVISARI